MILQIVGKLLARLRSNVELHWRRSVQVNCYVELQPSNFYKLLISNQYKKAFLNNLKAVSEIFIHTNTV